MFDAPAILKESGSKEDSDINVLHVALAFAAGDHAGISMDKYFNHANKCAHDIGARYIELLNAGASDDVRTRLAAIKHILCDREGYAGDSETYDDLQNADLIRVIDRRKGLPISLAILFLYAGRSNGWNLDGLNFPGHFLCRIEYKGERVIFDPFTSCKVMEAADLRALLKKIRGDKAELNADFYKPCTNREILIRLQNNIKLRLIEAEEYQGALNCVEKMRWMDPAEYRLLLDAGVLYAKTGRKPDAVDVLEKYIKATPNAIDKRDAENILRHIHETMD